jgi:hypothetical protein
MPTPRSDLATLSLTSTPSNFKKAKRLRELRPDVKISDTTILEQLLADAEREYEIAMGDVADRGTVIENTRYSSKGKAYTTENVNPYFRVASKLSKQIADLKVLLAKLAPKKAPDVVPGSAADLYPELFGVEKSN